MTMQVVLWVAALSLLCAAAALGLIAWRTSRRVRERESARVELLKALALPDATVPASGPSFSDWTAEFLSERGSPRDGDTYQLAATIFAEPAQPVMALPRWISLAGVGAAMALVVTLYAVIAGSPKSASAPTTVVPDRPIELIALRYRVEHAPAFEVSGIVRNPADGRKLSQLVAVVNLLDEDGRFLTSQETPIEQPVLEAGETSAFSVVVPRVTGAVGRYQVQFRLPGRDRIPHVDRRAPEPGANAPTS
jgi:hypothetical protein